MCPDKELSEEEGLGKVNGLTRGEGEGSRKRKGQPRPSWEAVSQVAGDSLAVPAEGCVQGGLMERKVSYYHLRQREWTRRHGYSGIGPRNLIRIYFFLQKSGILKESWLLQYKFGTELV